MNTDLVRLGVLTLLGGLALLTTLRALVQREQRRRERQILRVRLYHVRDGIRYRPARRRVRRDEATALRLRVLVNKTRREE